MSTITLICLGLSACSGTTEKKTETTTTETTVTATEKPASERISFPDAPTFASDEVNKGMAEYRTLIEDYLTAIDQKDQAKISTLTSRYQTVTMNMAEWATKLKPDETEKFTEYMKALGEKWQAAAMKIAAHQ